MRDQVRAVLGCVSARGWTVLALATGCWIIYAATAWVELAYGAVTLLALLVGSILLALGRVRLAVEFSLDPQRVVVGDSAFAHIEVTNVGASSLLSAIVRLPVGSGAHRFFVPPLAARGRHEDQVLIQATRRGVITVGPAITQRGDPFGLIERDLTWSQEQELYVLPVTTAVGPVGTGLLRDLEGRTTNDVSTSDLAFHTLRDYRPGDDSRHIHWASSEKHAGRRGLDGQDRIDEEELLVRQFLDTRRAHLGVVVDCDPRSYADADEFECAVSVGASVAQQAVRDSMQLTVVSGSVTSVRPAPIVALDSFARITPEDRALRSVTHRVLQLSPGISSAVLVSGGRIAETALLAAASQISHRTGTLVIRVATGSAPAVRRDRQLTLLTVGDLGDLVGTLQAVTAG